LSQGVRLNMGKFGFILHPLCTSDLSRKIPFAKNMPEKLIKRIVEVLPPVKVPGITSIESPEGRATGCFVAVPLLPEQMLTLPTDFVLGRILKACKRAQGMGAQIVGLGAFASVVGDKGLTIAKGLDIPVTTGNSYIVAAVLETIRRTCSAAGRALGDAQIVIVGASGSIGNACAKILAREARFLTLVSNDIKGLDNVAKGIMLETGLAVHTTNRPEGPLKRADIVITDSSAVDIRIFPECLKRGAILCDVARPRVVSSLVSKTRRDVLIIESGIVKVPGEMNPNLDFGLPPGMCYACMVEVMILAMEERFESFSIGGRLEVEKVSEIWKLGEKHGFTLAGIRSPEGFAALCDL
jgi:fatty aldehyde-generating acyl-ACP reductase